jgi:hypothetical protein
LVWNFQKYRRKSKTHKKKADELPKEEPEKPPAKQPERVVSIWFFKEVIYSPKGSSN